ncbi:MAG: hypothetical protein HQL76_01810 [Magnetococcales bacterium]|nr:hypothetical protein [Magnetococcales bacterium]
MKSSLNSPEMEGITPEYVMQLGKEWLDFLVDTTPEKELFSLPKFEHRLARERQKEAASMLTRQLQRRFGNLPSWANKK